MPRLEPFSGNGLRAFSHVCVQCRSTWPCRRFRSHLALADPARGQHEGTGGKFPPMRGDHIFANTRDALKEFILELIAFDQVHLIKGDTQHNQRLTCLGLPSI